MGENWVNGSLRFHNKEVRMYMMVLSCGKIRAICCVNAYAKKIDGLDKPGQHAAM